MVGWCVCGRGGGNQSPRCCTGERVLLPRPASALVRQSAGHGSLCQGFVVQTEKIEQARCHCGGSAWCWCLVLSKQTMMVLLATCGFYPCFMYRKPCPDFTPLFAYAPVPCA